MNFGWTGENTVDSGNFNMAHTTNRPFVTGGGQIYQGDVMTGHTHMTNNGSAIGGDVKQSTSVGLKLPIPGMGKLVLMNLQRPTEMPDPVNRILLI